ncbi:ABC transporter substrate-binding protein [Gordonia rhizosphera]|uniref:Putative peptide ABC transporter substrate-binding protein n=1 Tax=Gordonia rhizosphera NBRC 16068 TaxID=1108045 RepID=K6WWK0_9ACTN|nr:ABC transporter substrate-binding protein [Gordonia rhizosphera]GAB90939.1 putative peptide ABC transporter substrate-binding protein [Gordonia rhizosphera NBRC 16068]
MKRFLCWLAVVIAALMLTACGRGISSHPSDELYFSTSLGPRTWDPHPETRNFTYGWYSLVYDGLMTTDAQGSIIPSLATEWDLSPTALTMTLATGVTFADGTAFDAAAVKWNIEKEQAQAGTSPALKVISAVDVIDPTHVTFRLSRPAPNLVNQLAGLPGLMVSPGVSEKDLQAGVPAGTGPYVLDRDASQKDTKYVFTPNPTSWVAKSAHFKRVVGNITSDEVASANALRSHQVDVAYLTPTQAVSIGSDFEISTAPAYVQSFVILDAGGKKLAPLAEEKVRQAMALAVDRNIFVSKINGGYGEAVDQLFPEGAGHVDGYQAPQRDVARARQLLAEAGVDKVTIATSTWGSFSIGNLALKSMFGDIGVDLSLENVAPGQDIVGITGGDYPGVYTYIPDRDPLSVYAKYLSKTAPYNPYHHADPVIDAAMAKAVRNMGDPAAMDAAYADLMKRVYETGWIVPIARYETLIGYNPSTVTDVAAWTGVTAGFYIRDVKPVSTGQSQ